jgi:hypothetical protein
MTVQGPIPELDLVSRRVATGFARNPSGLLRSPAGYATMNSKQCTHAATFSELSGEDLNVLSNLMQATQTVKSGVRAFQ